MNSTRLTQRAVFVSLVFALGSTTAWADPILVGDYELTGKQGKRNVTVALSIRAEMDGKVSVTRTSTSSGGVRTWSGVGLRFGNRARVLFHAADEASGNLVDLMEPNADAPSFTNVISATYYLSNSGKAIKEKLFNLTKRGDESYWRNAFLRGQRVVEPEPEALPDTVPELVAALREVLGDTRVMSEPAGPSDRPLDMIKAYLENKLREGARWFIYREDVEALYWDEEGAATIGFDLAAKGTTGQLDDESKQQRARRILTALRDKGATFGTEGYEVNACGTTSVLLVLDAQADTVHGVDLNPCDRPAASSN